MAVIHIDIISDIVCAVSNPPIPPFFTDRKQSLTTFQWCYIGKKTLERAISLYQKTYPGGKNDVFKITWRPYYLDYHNILGAGISVDKSEVAKVKLADMSAERLEALRQRMDHIGRSVGILFKTDGKIGSTQAAHHLIHLCQTNSDNSVEVRDALVAGLFEAYHERERDIASTTVLREIAVEAGMDAAQVDECLNSVSEENVQESEVDREARENKETANTGVPLFIIQGVHKVDGAQDLMEFVEIFGKIREEEGQAAA